MFSDHLVTLAGRTITITTHDLFLAGFSAVIGLLLWALIYFSRKRIVVVKRSSGTDQLTCELSRIADALEHIANRPANRAVGTVIRGQQVAEREPNGIAYSMFGR